MTDYLDAIVGYSRLRVDVLNLNYCPIHRKLFELPAGFDLQRYQCVILHSTACYNAEQLFALDERRDHVLRRYRGVKVMLKQDEHYRTGRVLEYLGQANFDILATTLDADVARSVYSGRLPKLELVPVLTGYVTPYMQQLRYPPSESRPIDVGYRGSPQAWNFGRLAYEKFEIGERFAREAPPGLKLDISSRWEDRFFGQAWFDFLGRCKATLGVESGASVFDYTGEVERSCKAYLAEHPQASFDEVEAAVLAPHKDNVRYRTVSPRHLEAAATRTLQVLYEGEYRGILKPWEHYVPLRRDFSNLDEVVRILRDPAERERITDRAFRDIAASPELGYQRFVENLDDRIFARLGIHPSTPSSDVRHHGADR